MRWLDQSKCSTHALMYFPPSAPPYTEMGFVSPPTLNTTMPATAVRKREEESKSSQSSAGSIAMSLISNSPRPSDLSSSSSSGTALAAFFRVALGFCSSCSSCLSISSSPSSSSPPPSPRPETELLPDPDPPASEADLITTEAARDELPPPAAADEVPTDADRPRAEVGFLFPAALLAGAVGFLNVMGLGAGTAGSAVGRDFEAGVGVLSSLSSALYFFLIFFAGADVLAAVDGDVSLGIC